MPYRVDYLTYIRPMHMCINNNGKVIRTLQLTIKKTLNTFFISSFIPNSSPVHDVAASVDAAVNLTVECSVRSLEQSRAVADTVLGRHHSYNNKEGKKKITICHVLRLLYVEIVMLRKQHKVIFFRVEKFLSSLLVHSSRIRYRYRL